MDVAANRPVQPSPSILNTKVIEAHEIKPEQIKNGIWKAPDGKSYRISYYPRGSAQPAGKRHLTEQESVEFLTILSRTGKQFSELKGLTVSMGGIKDQEKSYDLSPEIQKSFKEFTTKMNQVVSYIGNQIANPEQPRQRVVYAGDPREEVPEVAVDPAQLGLGGNAVIELVDVSENPEHEDDDLSDWVVVEAPKQKVDERLINETSRTLKTKYGLSDDYLKMFEKVLKNPEALNALQAAMNNAKGSQNIQNFFKNINQLEKKLLENAKPIELQEALGSCYNALSTIVHSTQSQDLEGVFAKILSKVKKYPEALFDKLNEEIDTLEQLFGRLLVELREAYMEGNPPLLRENLNDLLSEVKNVEEKNRAALKNPEAGKLWVLPPIAKELKAKQMQINLAISKHSKLKESGIEQSIRDFITESVNPLLIDTCQLVSKRWLLENKIYQELMGRFWNPSLLVAYVDFLKDPTNSGHWNNLTKQIGELENEKKLFEKLKAEILIEHLIAETGEQPKELIDSYREFLLNPTRSQSNLFNEIYNLEADDFNDLMEYLSWMEEIDSYKEFYKKLKLEM